MKAKVLFGVALLLLASLVVSGCSTGVSQEAYDAVVTERDTAQAALAELQETCPPGNFESLTELETWLASNTISKESTTTYAEAWFRKALRLQEDALEDGYIISADYDVDQDTGFIAVWCTTIISGTLFFWDPESDEVFEEFGFGTLQ